MQIGKAAIAVIIAVAISPLLTYLVLPSYSTSALTVPVINNLIVVADDVFITRGDIEQRVDTKQAILKQGDIIRTSADTGRALINFFDGSSTQLEPGAEISVDALSMSVKGSTTIQFTQNVGTTWSRVTKLVDTKSSFNVKTASAVAIIRGTLIAINVDESDGVKTVTEVKVFEGLSDVYDTNGRNRVSVGGGNQTLVTEGEKPQTPQEIPPPPSELNITVASPVWLHVADPYERNAGIVPPGFEANEIPLSTNTGDLDEEQSINIDEPVAGRYYIMTHARGDGPVSLTVQANNDGVLFDQKLYSQFIVTTGDTYYVTVDVEIDDNGQITSFTYSDVYLPPKSVFSSEREADGGIDVAVNDSLQFTGGYGQGYYTSEEWGFGDGTTSDQQNPSHVYDEAGVYTLQHIVENPVTRQTTVKTDYVTVYSTPQSAFGTNYTVADQDYIEVVVGLNVNFYDQTIGGSSSWAWDFGDESTSDQQHPSYAYTLPGAYTVSLTTSNIAGDNTLTKTGYVLVFAELVADFTAVPTSLPANKPVQFTDLSTGVASAWAWTFGDGGTSDVQNPTHSYSSAGLYEVSLFVSNPLDSDVVLKTGYIDVYADITNPTVTLADIADFVDEFTIINGTAADLAPGELDKVQVQIKKGLDSNWWDGNDWVDSAIWVDAAGTTSWSYTMPTLEEQNYIVTAKSIDKADNESEQVSDTSNYDTTVPTVTLDDIADFVDELVIISGTAADAPYGILDKVQVQIKKGLDSTWWDGNGWVDSGAAWVDAFGTASWTYTMPALENQNYTVTAKSVDKIGNQSAQAFDTFNYDATNPIVMLDDIADSLDELVVIGGTAADLPNGTLDKVQVQIKRDLNNTWWDGNDWVASAIWVDATGSASWTYTMPALEIESYTITARAIDILGNQSTEATDSFMFGVIVDVDITSPVDAQRFETRTIDVQGTVGDSNVTTATLTVNGSASTIAISRGQFDQSVNILEGVNTITVAVAYPGYTGSSTITVYGDIPQVDVQIKLTWDTDVTDFDSHFIWSQDANYWQYYDDRDYDCYYHTDDPDWDGSGDLSSGDPVLDTDDTDGFGPEFITLTDVSTDDRYWFFVHYYSDDRLGASIATVEILIDDQVVFQSSRLMEDDYVWEAAYIDWANGTGTVHAGPEDAYYVEGAGDDYHAGL
ncbi:MAG: PKD domain-containing protein [Chloroflexi bacterium]|nr:PKD domain-containing protein [Chloroflexota bacterium]MBT7081571.1 PKD domain-containing protein [Chloroflexota bacterium]MBT7288975.1 PKD domain-containing protein [Chloroflexota bacterium]